MCRKISYIIIILIVFMLSCGCASKMDVLNENNVKVPDNIYTSQHIPSGLSVQAFIAAMSGGNADAYAYPEKYLELGNFSKVNKLNYSTTMISGRIKVLNPEQQNYSVKLHSEKKYSETKYPYKCTRVLYKGNVEQKILSFHEEVERHNPLVKCNIIVESEDTEVFNIQTSYKIE